MLQTCLKPMASMQCSGMVSGQAPGQQSLMHPETSKRPHLLRLHRGQLMLLMTTLRFEFSFVLPHPLEHPCGYFYIFENPSSNGSKRTARTR